MAGRCPQRLLRGVAVAALFLAPGYYVLPAHEQAAPGIGITLPFVALTAVALGVESTLAAGVGGLEGR